MLERPRNEDSKELYNDKWTIMPGLPFKDERIDLWLGILKTLVNMLLLGLAGFHMFSNNVPVLQDVWFVVYMLCLFRLIESSWTSDK